MVLVSADYRFSHKYLYLRRLLNVYLCGRYALLNVYLMCTYDLLKLYLGVLKYLYATYTSLTFHRIRQGSAAINCGESHASTASHPLRFYVQKRFAPKSDRVLDISSSRRQTQTIKFQAFSYRIFFSRPPHHEDERD